MKIRKGGSFLMRGSSNSAYTSTQEMILPESITLNYTTYTLDVDETFNLVATVLPENSTFKRVTWSTSDETIATVNSSGVVTGVGAGNVTITATTANGLTATCSVVVNGVDIEPESITLNKETTVLNPGETDQLIATVLPASTIYKTVTWSSSDPTIATVNSDGLVTGVKSGNAIITATTTNGLTATCDVLVLTEVILPESITLDRTTVKIVAGMDLRIYATVLPADAEQTVTWISSDDAIVTVDNGLITGIAVGEATITASTVNGLTATCVVTVIESEFDYYDGINGTSVELLPNVDENNHLVVTNASSGAQYKTKTARLDTDSALPWDSPWRIDFTFTLGTYAADDMDIPIANGIDVVKDKIHSLYLRYYARTSTYYLIFELVTSDGETALRKSQRIFDNTTANSAKLVIGQPYNVSIQYYDVTSNSLWIDFDGTYLTEVPISAEIKESEWKPFYWLGMSLSSTASYANSNTNYLLDKLHIDHLVIEAESIELDKDSVIMESDEEPLQLNATISPWNATNKTITWTSSNESAATVDQNGLVTLVGVGGTTITATTANGLTDTCTFNVIVPVPFDYKNELNNTDYVDIEQWPNRERYTGALVLTDSSSTVNNNRTAYLTDRMNIMFDDESWEIEVKFSSPSYPTGTVNIPLISNNKYYDPASHARLEILNSSGSGNFYIRYQNQESPETYTATSVKFNFEANSLQPDVIYTIKLINHTDIKDKLYTKFEDGEEVETTIDASRIGMMQLQSFGMSQSSGTAQYIPAFENTKLYRFHVNKIFDPQSVLIQHQGHAVIQIGDTKQFTAQVLPENASNKDGVWSISDESKATVNQNGLVTGVAEGICNLTFTTWNGKAQSIAIEVGVVPTTLSFVEHEVVIGKGFTKELEVDIEPDNSTLTLTWETDNQLVATVDSSGVVTAHNVGTANIRVTSANGLTDTCLVTVPEPDMDYTDTNSNTVLGNISRINVETGYYEVPETTEAGELEVNTMCYLEDPLELRINDRWEIETEFILRTAAKPHYLLGQSTDEYVTESGGTHFSLLKVTPEDGVIMEDGSTCTLLSTTFTLGTAYKLSIKSEGDGKLYTSINNGTATATAVTFDTNNTMQNIVYGSALGYTCIGSEIQPSGALTIKYLHIKDLPFIYPESVELNKNELELEVE